MSLHLKCRLFWFWRWTPTPFWTFSTIWDIFCSEPSPYYFYRFEFNFSYFPSIITHCHIGSSKLFEIICIDFVCVSGSHFIQRIFEIRTEWVVSAYYFQDLGFSNKLIEHICTALVHICSIFGFNLDSKFHWCFIVVSILSNNIVDVTLWFNFCHQIVLMSRCWSKYCLKKIVLWLWYYSEPISPYTEGNTASRSV